MRPSINRVLESSYVQDSLRAFSQELASQTERDKQIYDEKRKKRPERHAAPVPTMQAQPASPPKKDSKNEMTFEDLKKMDRGSLSKALAAHKDVAESEMAKREPSKPAGNFIGISGGTAEDSDGDDAHVDAKVTMRGHIREIIDKKGKLGDNNVMEPTGDRDNSGVGGLMRMPSGETVDRRDVRRYLESKVGASALKKAVDFLTEKLSSEDQSAVGDAHVQQQLTAMLGGKKEYANIVSKLVLYEASSAEGL